MNKRWVALMVLFLLLLTSLAMAESGEVPFQILSDIASRFSSYTIVDYVNPGMQDTAFVSVRADYGNNLLCYRNTNGYWQYTWNRPELVPQEDNIMLYERSYSNYAGLRLGVAFSAYESPYGGYETVWEKNGNQWTLRALLNLDSAGNIVESFIVRSDGVTYSGWDTGGESKRVNGSVQTNIRYFIFSIFPKNYATLRSKLSTPPAIPEGMLNARNIKFTGGGKYAVYTGPGEYYVRGGNGKAMVSTNDWIQVFGEENDWILIQYNISKGKMRFGWIYASALPVGEYVNDLDFNAVTAFTNQDVSLTDDPLNSQDPLMLIPANSMVEWLASMGEWAYVEVNGEVTIRGFVPVDAIGTQSAFQITIPPMENGVVVLNGMVSIVGYQGAVSFSVEGGGPLGNAVVTSFRIYDTYTGALLGTAIDNYGNGMFTGTFALDSGATSLTIVGVAPNGNEYRQFAVRAEW